MASRKHASQPGEECTIGGTQIGPRHLATQDCNLVAEHDQFDVLVEAWAEPQDDELEQTSERPVRGGEFHAGMIAEALVGSQIGIFGTHTANFAHGLVATDFSSTTEGPVEEGENHALIMCTHRLKCLLTPASSCRDSEETSRSHESHVFL